MSHMPATAGMSLSRRSFEHRVLDLLRTDRDLSTIYKPSLIILSLIIAIVITSCGTGMKLIFKDADYPDNREYFEISKKPVWVIGNDIIQRLNAGEFKDIEEYIDYLVAEKPYTVNGTRVLEELYWFVGKRVVNSDMLDKWCAKEPSHHSAFIFRGRYYIKEAWIARGHGFAYSVTQDGWKKFRENLELAKNDLEKAYAMNPDDPNSAAFMIRVCLGLSRSEDEKESWFKRAVAADPVAYHAYAQKQNYVRPKWGGTKEKDRAFAEQCYENAPSKSIIHEIMLDYIIENYKWSENRDNYYHDPSILKTIDDVVQKTLKIFPDAVSIKIKLAKIEAIKKNYEEAVSLYSEILESDPGNPDALRERGDLYDRFQRNSELAEADIIKSVESDPYGPNNFEALAKIANIRGNYQKAVEYYTSAIERNPKALKLYVERGFIKMYSLQDNASALEDFRTAEKMDSSFIATKINIANCLERMGRFLEAKTYCMRALELIEMQKSGADGRMLSRAGAENLKRTLNAMLSGLNGDQNQYPMKNTNHIPVDQRKIIPVLPSEILSQYTGTYKLNPDTNVIIRLINLRLISQLTGHGAVALLNESKMKFINSKLNMEVEFFKDDSGNITHLMLRQDGVEKKAVRTSDKVTDRYTVTLTADTMSRYEGTYKMGPRDLNITMENNYLFAQFPGLMKKALFPESETVFFDNIIDTRLEFFKDDSGKVSHLLFIQGNVTITAPRKAVYEN